MLKKLLASALAVATVASCAYVPTALASAATTYKTADVLEYENYKLSNPDTSAETTTATIYVASNGAEAGTYELKGLKAGENTVENVKANLKDAVNTETTAKISFDVQQEADTPATKNELSYLVKSDRDGYYVAYVSHKTQVQYNPIDVLGTAGVEAWNKLSANKELGWYENPSAQNVIAEMYTKGLSAEVKVAGYAFATWKYDTAKALVTPDAKEVNGTTPGVEYYYTKVDLKKAADNASTGAELTTGLYYKKDANTAVCKDDLYLPNNDKSNWNTYLINYIKAGLSTAENVTDNATSPKTYEFAGVRYVKAATSTEDAVYAVIYKATASGSKGVKYTLRLENTAGTTLVEYEKATSVKTFTTDPAEIYKILKAAGATEATSGATLPVDTLAEYLKVLDIKQADGKYYTIYETTNTLTELKQDTTAEDTDYKGEVVVGLRVAPKYLANVYYFGNGTVEKNEVYLTEAQLEDTTYGLMGVGGTAISEEVLKATRDALGANENAVVEGVPAQYAYAKAANAADKGTVIIEVNTTYILGEATANKADFQTATGAFQVEPYFCRENAYVGDKVMLKVALTDAGKAKGLDINKVTVEYDVVGCTAGTNYHFVPAEGDTRPEGIATDITLAEGTNIAVAKVKYNGVVVATFDPFYAVAIAK